MLKKGQLVKFSRPVSTMKTVLEAIEQGHCYRHILIVETSLNENQVRSAIWNLAFIGAIKRTTDDQGRTKYVTAGEWTEDIAPCLLGVNSIFNVGTNPFTKK
jgi:hypothetical protein